MKLPGPELPPPRAAVFLDKDGTVVENCPFDYRPASLRLRPGTVAGLRQMQVLGYVLVLATNQPGPALGLGAARAVALQLAALRGQLREQGVQLLACAVCMHHPLGRDARYRGVCLCRKPAPGLLLDSARRHGIDLGRSWMVGDILDDVEAGRRAGCRTALVAPGGETEWRWSAWRWPHLVVPDLAAMAARLPPAPGAG